MWKCSTKEMLANVFAAEKFDQYTFDHSTTVPSDHKSRRSRHSVLQSACNCKELLRDCISILLRSCTHEESYSIYLTLYRPFIYRNQVTWPLDSLKHISMVQYLQIIEQRLQQMKGYTSSDVHLQQLRAVIMDVWPTEKKVLPH